MSQRATEINENLIGHSTSYDISEIIVSDNGSEFNIKVIKELMDLHNMKIHYVSTRHPPPNELCERVNSTLVEHTRLLNNQPEFQNDTIINKVQYADIAYNNTIDSVKKLTPIEILYRHLNTKSILNINLENKIVNDYINSHKEMTKKLYEHIRK